MKLRIRLVVFGLLLVGGIGCAGAVDTDFLFELDLDPNLEQQNTNEDLIGENSRALAAAATAMDQGGGAAPAESASAPSAPVTAIVPPANLCPIGDTRFFASSAASDPAVHNGNHRHSVWMPKFFCNKTAKFDFEAGATVDHFAAGGARIRGVAVVSSGGCGREGERWDVDVYLNDAPPGSMVPKLELKNPSVNQPTSITDAWEFFILDETRATLTQIDGPGRATLRHRPTNLVMGFQTGLTANGKNTNFGNSGWFYYSHEPGDGAPTRNGHGDFNLDLEECMDQPPTVSYTAWGGNSCSESVGYRAAYSGVMHAVEGSQITSTAVALAVNGPFCVPEIVTGSVFSTTGATRIVHFLEGGQPFPCTVCVK